MLYGNFHSLASEGGQKTGLMHVPLWHWFAEQFDINGYVHVFSPGTGADNPFGSFFFSLTVLFSKYNPLLLVFLH